MMKTSAKSKMTLDKLATMTQREFLAVRKDMATKDDLKHFATKDDLKHFATKDDLKHFATKDDLQTTEVKILQAVDKIATRFDRAEKEEAAHAHLHKRIADDLHDYGQRIRKLEARV